MASNRNSPPFWRRWISASRRDPVVESPVRSVQAGKFEHSITREECESSCLKLVDIDGSPFGDQLPAGNDGGMALVDETGRPVHVRKIDKNLLRAAEWFRRNAEELKPGTVVSIRLVPGENVAGYPVLNVAVLRDRPVRPRPSSPTSPSLAGSPLPTIRAQWQDLAVKALKGLGGEASSREIIRWVMLGQTPAEDDWQHQLRQAIRDHADGRGENLFQSVGEWVDLWKLTEGARVGDSAKAVPSSSISRGEVAPATPQGARSEPEPSGDPASALSLASTPVCLEEFAADVLRSEGGKGTDRTILWQASARLELEPGWRVKLLAAIRANADGKGKCLFVSVPNSPGRWQLTELALETRCDAAGAQVVGPAEPACSTVTVSQEAHERESSGEVPADHPATESSVGSAVEFQIVLSVQECKSTYLNLRGTDGKVYGHALPGPHKARMVIVDGSGRVTYAQKHKGNSVWGGIKSWYSQNGATPGTLVRISHDPAETIEGLPVVHIIADGTAEDGPPVTVGRWATREGRRPKADSVAAGMPGSLQHLAPSAGRLIAQALKNADGTPFTAIELFLLARMAAELEMHSQATALLDRVSVEAMDGHWRRKVAQLRALCAMKLEG